MRIIRRLIYVLLCLAVLAAFPIGTNEATCVAEPGPGATFASQLDPADRRDSAGTYLSYPEWAVVYAYRDLAAVTTKSSESGFDYTGAIRDYWSSVCSITRLTSQRAPTTFGSRVVLYVIGLSFSAEMGLKGAYERTIGALTVYLRGPAKTPEDVFAVGVADEYAKFLLQEPWYNYPFASKLASFWLDVPVSGGNIVRGFDRRIGLSLEWGGKALYGTAMKAAAGAAMSVPTRIRSVVTDLDPADVGGDDKIELVKVLPGGGSIIETGRYGLFTDALGVLALRGRHLSEIAGNTRVLATVLVPEGTPTAISGATLLFDVPVQSQPGYRRVGIDVAVTQLTDLITAIKGTPAQLEMVYDFY